MAWKNRLKEYRIVHWIYNLLHYKSLLHNKAAYRKYLPQKPLIASVSSRDFPDRESGAWLDRGHSRELAGTRKAFQDFPESVQQQLLGWSDNGYLILEHFFDDAVTESVNREIEKLQRQHRLVPTHDNKLMFANRISPLIQSLTADKQLTGMLSFILDREVVPFQTLNFIHGSGQRAHSDSIHMTTYPLGYLIAAWIALEDTSMENGPLFYYPGSHRMPYLLNGDLYPDRKRSLAEKNYTDYEDLVARQIETAQLEKKIFLARKGDVLIWHANLIHGGMPVTRPELTRKSMVIHYYAKDVVKYHEFSERPSLLEE